MAAKRKATTNRKSTAKNKGIGAKPLPGRKKFGEKIYTKESCHTKKSDANAKAKKLRATGKNARVMKDPATGRNCVFVRGRAKAKKRA